MRPFAAVVCVHGSRPCPLALRASLLFSAACEERRAAVSCGAHLPTTHPRNTHNTTHTYNNATPHHRPRSYPTMLARFEPRMARLAADGVKLGTANVPKGYRVRAGAQLE